MYRFCKMLAVSLSVFCLLPLSLQAVTINDGGMDREFEIALDQAASWNTAGQVSIDSIRGASDVAALKSQLESRARISGLKQGLVVYESGKSRELKNARIVSDQVLVVFASQVNLASKSRDLGTSLRNPRSGHSAPYALATAKSPSAALDLAARLKTQPDVVSAEPILLRMHSKKFLPNDTHFGDQWHLRNTGQDGATVGIDVNITNVWPTYTGSGITIGIVDDGFQFTHPDLSANANTTIDYDWNDGDFDPTPSEANQDWHGTACAGVAGAKGNNSTGVAGSAYDATLVGLRLIAGFVGDVEEAEAMSHSNSLIHIKSNSWGPYDDGSTLEAPGTLTKAALADGIANGRGGLGTLYPWAGGNGLDVNDNANYDGYANSIYTIAIAALGDDGMQAWYSEPGACLIACTPSSDDNQGITTTDLAGEDGYNYTGAPGEMADKDYTLDFGGTSSATPLAAGILALMLEANPLLGWRDVQEILIATAFKVHAVDGDWSTNGAGFDFNHKYGAGLIDADAAVNAALTWTNLGPQLSEELSQTSISAAIPDNDVNGVTRNFDFSSTALRVEHVTVEVDISHNSRGNLAITLISPAGTESRLTEEHSDTGNNYSGWLMSSVHNWGEDSWGTWSVKVADTAAGTVGTLNSVKVTLYGTASGDASNRPPNLVSPGNQSVHVTNNLSFTISASDIDDDAITLSASNLPSGATFTTAVSNGAVSSDFSWMPATNQVGTYTVYFTAGDKDGTNTKSVVIDVYDLSGAVDIGGYTIYQYNSSQSAAIPASTLITEGGYLIIARDIGQGAFESFWGVTLGPNVTFINSRGTMPLINGAETYELKDDLGVTVDGETGLALNSGQTVERNNAADDSTLSGSWTASAMANATPGSGATGNGLSGLVISEYSDASDFVYEFIEIYYDGGGVAPPGPPILSVDGGSSQDVTVSNSLVFTVSATESDGDTITLLAQSLPAGATFPGATGTSPVQADFSWTPEITGTYTAVFTAEDADGVDTQVVTITVNEVFVPGPTLDISGYQIKQYNSSQSFTFPATTEIESGGYLILCRNGDKAGFEAHWGVSLPAGTAFVNSSNKVPQINGAETYELLDDLAATIDGETGQALSAGNTAQRNNTTDDATLAGSWTMSAVANATPGSGASGNGTAGLVINEYSDASGDFNYEFVELYYDTSGGPAPSNQPPVFDALSAQAGQVGSGLQFTVSVTEIDGDTVSLVPLSLPGGAAFAGATGAAPLSAVFDWTPAATGAYTAVFTAEDVDGIVTQSVNITVAEAPPPAIPVFAALAGQNVLVSNLLQFTVNVTEDDGDIVTLLAQSIPGGATFPGATGTSPVSADFDWTPTATGTYTAIFTAEDVDGIVTQEVTITVTEGAAPGSTLDISGYTLYQYNASYSYTFGPGTEIEAGGYIVLGRNSDKAAFEGFWGITLPSNVLYLNSTNLGLTINGDETFELQDDLAATIDGESGLALVAGNTVQRNSAADDGTLAGSWTASADTFATPGSGASGNGSSGLVISEYSDASGSGNFIYEFVELYYDASGGPPPGDEDGDGISDDYELEHSGTTTGLVAGADDDLDGFTNEQEFHANTQPTNGNSYLHITAINGEGLLEIEFPASTTREYYLDYAPQVQDGLWGAVSPAAAGTGSVMNLIHSNANNHGVYRLNVRIP